MVGAGFPQALGVEREVEARLGVGWSMGTSSNLNLRLMTGWSALPTRSSPLVWKWKSLSHVQLFATPWTVHEILQARILEWVTFSFSRGSSQPRDWTQVSSIAGRLFTSWTSHISTYRLANPQSINKCQWGFSCVSESCTLQLDSGFKFPMPSGPGEQIRKWKQKPKSVVWKLIVQINARLQHNLQTAACE